MDDSKYFKVLINIINNLGEEISSLKEENNSLREQLKNCESSKYTGMVTSETTTRVPYTQSTVNGFTTFKHNIYNKFTP